MNQAQLASVSGCAPFPELPPADSVFMNWRLKIINKFKHSQAKSAMLAA